MLTFLPLQCERSKRQKLRKVSTGSEQLDGVDLEVKTNDGEDETFEILNEVVERSQALWVSERR